MCDRRREADVRPPPARAPRDPHRRAVWRGGDAGEPVLLAACYRRVFEIADANRLRSLAFPAISCGVYGYPLAPAVAIAVHEVRAAMSRASSVEDVLFACFDDRVLDAYQHELAATRR